MIEKLINITDIVLKVLKESEKARNNDAVLRAKVWAEQNPRCRDYSFPAPELLEEMIKENLANPESIRRARQKLQEQHPELRGLTYKERQVRSVEMRETMPKLTI